MEKLVYDVPMWHDYSYNAIAGHAGKLNEIISEAKQMFPEYSKFSQEVFSRMFGDNKNKIGEVKYWNRWAERTHQAITDIPEAQKLAENVRGDSELALAVTTSLVQKVFETLPKDTPLEDGDSLKDQINYLNSSDIPDAPFKAAKIMDRILKNEEAAKDLDEAFSEDVIRAVLRKEIDSLTEFTETMQGFGGVGNKDCGVNPENTKRYLKLYDRLKYDKSLKKLLDLCGMMQNLYRSEKKKTPVYERSEYSDITRGADLSRILPSELGMEELFDVKFIKNELMMHDVKTKDSLHAGPVMLALDFSGSMLYNDNYLVAQAVAVTLFNQLKKEKRDFQACLFGNSIIYEFSHTRGDIFEFIEFVPNAGEGTDATPVMEWIAEKRIKDSDVIIVTDGGFEPVKSPKLQDCTVLGVLVGCTPSPGFLSIVDKHACFDNMATSAGDIFRFVM